MQQEKTTAKILVIHNQHSGDMNNILALAEVIQKKNGCDIEVIHCGMRLRLLVPIMEKLLLHARSTTRLTASRTRNRLWNLFFHGTPPSSDSYNIIISTLGQSEAASAFISAYWRAPNIHLGSPKRLDPKNFSAIIAHPGQVPRPGEIALPTAPSSILLDDCIQAALQLQISSETDKVFGLLIGSDSKEVIYDNSYWQNLFDFVLASAKSENATWLVSTSPRTSAKITNKLRSLYEQHPEAIADIFLFSDTADNRLSAYIGASHAVFVTAESVSMISDVISTGRPVIAVGTAKPPNSPRIRRFLSDQSAHGRLAYLDIFDWRAFTHDIRHMNSLDKCWSDVLFEELHQRGIGKYV